MLPIDRFFEVSLVSLLLLLLLLLLSLLLGAACAWGKGMRGGEGESQVGGEWWVGWRGMWMGSGEMVSG